MPRIITTVGDEEVTNLDWLVGLVEKTSTFDYKGAERTFTIRMPLTEAARIDAMARQAGITRNAICVQFLEYALDEVMAKLSRKTIKEVKAIEGELLAEMIKEGE